METKDKQNNLPIDLSILDNVKEKWVVLSKDYKEIIKSADDIKELNDYSDKGITMFVINPDYSYCPIIK